MNDPITDIVVTGSAVISAAGTGVEAVLELVRTGRDALSEIPSEVLGAEGFRWGKADGFKASEFIPPLRARKMDRCSQFAVAAAGLALKDAGIDMGGVAPGRVGIALGSGFCGVSASAEFLSGFFSRGTEGLLPMIFPNTVPNAPASNASIEHGFTGPNVTLVQRFCSAESAFLLACRFIQEGRADVMLTGGTDELAPVTLRGLVSLGRLHRGSVPFGEGAGIIVLERGSHARRRGALIRGSVECVRSIGMLLPGREQEGLGILAGGADDAAQVSLSGTAAEMPPLLERVAAVPAIAVGRAVGVSLAMGGTALATLLASLPPGARGLHLAASPEGPCFSLDVMGGDPV